MCFSETHAEVMKSLHGWAGRAGRAALWDGVFFIILRPWCAALVTQKEELFEEGENAYFRERQAI